MFGVFGKVWTNDYEKNLRGNEKKQTIVFVVKFNLLLFFIINREYFDRDFAINAKTISTKGKPKIFSI